MLLNLLPVRRLAHYDSCSLGNEDANGIMCKTHKIKRHLDIHGDK